MRKFDDARAMFDRARAIAPNDPVIPLRRAETDVAAGDLAAAAGIFKEPPSFGNTGYGAYITMLIFQRKYEEAIAKVTADLQQAHRTTSDPASVASAHRDLGELHRLAGHAAESRSFLLQAEAQFGAMREQGNNSPDVQANLILVHAELGRAEEVERAAAAYIAAEAKDRWGGPRAEENAARAFCLLGDHERSLSILERLLAQSYADSITPALLRMEPIWDPMRSHPRFQRLSEPEQP
jgi:tetratricopeptide (TPR) repeat protein